MRSLINIIVSKRHYFIVEEEVVTEVLTAINSHESFHVDKDLEVGCCDWDDDKSKWYIHFNITDRQWRFLVDDLIERKFKLNIEDGSKSVYLSREIEA